MPVVKGNLKKNVTYKKRKNYTYLLHEIDGKILVDYLYQEEIFDLNDKEEICRLFPQRKRTDLLLTKLLHAGPYKAYDVFLKAVTEHYPHVAERLEKTGNGKTAEELHEMHHSTHTQEEIDQRVEIIKWLKIYGNVPFSALWCLTPHHHDSDIPASSFNMRHLPAGFQNKEVVDCVHSLAEQTVLAVEVSGPFQTSSDKKSWISDPLCSGRVWRVQRKFSTRSKTTCPCNDCECSTTPRKRWGEYIVLTDSNFCFLAEQDTLRFVLGYDSHKKVLDVSVLKAVSVIRNDDSLGYAEILCITHDADTGMRVEDICHRNTVNREKLLSRCHLLQKDKKLAVHVSHPHWGPKHIIVGEWLGYDSDSEPDSPRHVYTAATCNDIFTGSSGGPVLLIDGSNASVTLHYRTDKDKNVSYSCDNLWSL